MNTEPVRGQPRRRWSGIVSPVENNESLLSSPVEDTFKKEEQEENNILEDMETTIEDDTNSSLEPTTLRRSTRTRSHTDFFEPSSQVSNKKVKLTEKSNLKDIKKYYLDKNVKRLNPTLETIFEEPQVINNSEVVMSSRKFKRLIAFNTIAVRNNAKIKKRKAKAKKLKNPNKSKVTLDLLKEKLDELETDL